MKLKRTTVLSGNFAKKGNPMSARGRAASENVQLVAGSSNEQRKYSLVGGNLGLGIGNASVKEEENSDGADYNEDIEKDAAEDKQQ